MKIAHVGNIASNAYLNAKRDRSFGIEADCFDHGAGPAQWTPPWEDAEWDWPVFLRPTDAPDWRQITFTNGYERPSWAKSLGWNGGPAWFDHLDDDFYHRVASLDDGMFDSSYVRDEPLRAIADAYDLVILYGADAGYGLSFPTGTRFVTFECSTMRSVPTRTTPDRRLLAAAYQRAAANIITNADCWRAAGELDIRDRCRFIPHPIDLDKFSPDRAEEGAALRAQLCAEARADLLFLAPARQQSAGDPDTKGNHKILAAFARYVHESESAGAPRAALVLLQWGSNLGEANAWVDALGLSDRVLWVRPAPKVRFSRLYAAADIVLDQFAESVGSYGTTTVEALAMGKPVITHIDTARHRWCTDVIPVPPHQQAHTSQGIWEWMTTLSHSAEVRKNAGEDGSAWAREWCSPQRLHALYGQLYRDVLN